MNLSALFLRSFASLSATLLLLTPQATAAPAEGPPASAADRYRLAQRILADEELRDVRARARELLRTGLNAGSGYREVWIRDLNTFIELALEVTERRTIRDALLTFFKFQGPGGDIVDGYVPAANGSVGYQYRKSALAPDLLAHKNTVETDQESSLIQAVARYVRVTGDRGILAEEIDGRTVLARLGFAADYLLKERFDSRHGLIWGATTADWGDVQPEHEWGVELDASSHRAIDIYDNALFLVALNHLIELQSGDPAAVARWTRVAGGIRDHVRRHLWDPTLRKFIPHVYLEGSPFPADFDERAIWYHGGTAVAIEAGLLSPEEVRSSLAAMRANVRAAPAASLGLTVYPPYPDGFFKNPSMKAWSYQNGGDWCWFGGRMIQQLIAQGLVEEAYVELKPMVSRVIRHNGFYEWWTRDNQPKGSGHFRGSAGVLGSAIDQLLAWAAKQPRVEALPAR